MKWQKHCQWIVFLKNTTWVNKKLFSLCETCSFCGWKASYLMCRVVFFLNETAQTSLRCMLESICLKSLWREWNTRQNQCLSLSLCFLSSAAASHLPPPLFLHPDTSSTLRNTLLSAIVRYEGMFFWILDYVTACITSKTTSAARSALYKRGRSNPPTPQYLR